MAVGLVFFGAADDAGDGDAFPSAAAAAAAAASAAAFLLLGVPVVGTAVFFPPAPAVDARLFVGVPVRREVGELPLSEEAVDEDEAAAESREVEGDM